MAKPEDAGDPDSVREKTERLQNQAERRGNLLRAVMGTAEGQEYLYELLSRCHIHQSSFVIGAPDASAFREGERNIGLQLVADLTEASPDLYFKLLKDQGNGGRTQRRHPSSGGDQTARDPAYRDASEGDAGD